MIAHRVAEGLLVGGQLGGGDLALEHRHQAVDGGGAGIAVGDPLRWLAGLAVHVVAALMPDRARGALDLEPDRPALVDPARLDRADRAGLPTLAGETQQRQTVVVHIRIDAAAIGDHRRHRLDRPEEPAQQVHRVGVHVHERAAAGQLRVVKPLEIGIIEPAPVRGVVRVAIARRGDGAELARAHQLGDRAHLPAEGLEVAADGRRGALRHDRAHDRELCGVGHHRLIAHHGLGAGQRLLEQPQVAGVLRADEEGVDRGVGEQGLQLRHEGRAT